MSVTWVLNASSKYEISSKEHLLQLMNKGTLYTNLGSPPSNFLTSDYIQTADIDLEGDSTNIVPIGGTGLFTGEYDGNSFAVSNWAYVDPNLGNTPLADVGFFSQTNSATVKNVRLAGVCTLDGFSSKAGMLVGQIRNCTFYNIEVDLSPGSYINQGDNQTYADMGAVIGLIGGASTVTAVTFRGQMDSMVASDGINSNVGGVVGYVSGTGLCTLFRNLGHFPSGLSGYMAGGIAGIVSGFAFTNMMNAMTGNITSADKTFGMLGGIMGRCLRPVQMHNIVNSMKGDIINSLTGTSASGILGQCIIPTEGASYYNIFNYMGGDIINNASEAQSNGILNAVSGTADWTNSINAMNGATWYSSASPTFVIDVVIDTSFGLTFMNEGHTPSTPVTGLPTDPSSGLPMVDLTTTDPDGVTHTFDFVFGNFAVVYPLTITPRALSVSVVVGPVSGATAYRLTSQKTGSPMENTAKSTFTDLEQTIKNLEPDTEYTFRLYSTSGAGYSLVDESVLSTLQNSASNYDKNDFVGTSGRFDLSSLDSVSVGFMSDIMNDIFATGDVIDISVPGGRTKTSKFVNRGGNVAVEDSEALVAPFSKDGGAGQSVSLTLSDASVVAVLYDETTEAITVEGSEYASGDYFVLDGKKATIVDI